MQKENIFWVLLKFLNYILRIEQKKKLEAGLDRAAWTEQITFLHLYSGAKGDTCGSCSTMQLAYCIVFVIQKEVLSCAILAVILEEEQE